LFRYQLCRPCRIHRTSEPIFSSLHPSRLKPETCSAVRIVRTYLDDMSFFSSFRNRRRFVMVRLSTLVAAVIGFVHAPPALQAGDPFRFPEARYGRGDLRYINGLPVVSLTGTPEEIGEQMRMLTRSASPYLFTYPAKFLKSKGQGPGDSH